MKRFAVITIICMLVVPVVYLIGLYCSVSRIDDASGGTVRLDDFHWKYTEAKDPTREIFGDEERYQPRYFTTEFLISDKTSAKWYTYSLSPYGTRYITVRFIR